MDELQKAFYEVSSKIYQQAQPNADATAQGADNGANGDGYYDADFNVKNDN